RQTAIGYRKGTELHVVQTTKLRLAAQSKLGDFVGLEQADNGVEPLGFPFGHIDLQPILRARTRRDGQSSARSDVYPMQSSHPRTHGASAPSPSQIEIPQHEAGPAGFADAVAEIVRLGARVGADPDLVEGVGAAAALGGAQDARIAATDHLA